MNQLAELQAVIQFLYKFRIDPHVIVEEFYTTMILHSWGVELNLFVPLELVIVKKWCVTNAITCTHHHHEKLKFDPNRLKGVNRGVQQHMS